jgi:hypothetical protein
MHVLNRHNIDPLMPPYHCEGKAGCGVETLTTIAGRQLGEVLLQLRREQQEQQRLRGIQPKKKSVRFASDVKVYPIRHLNDFTNDEMKKMWYNEQEWNNIKQDCFAITSVVSDKTLLLIAQRSGYFRGLESCTLEGFQRRKRNRSRAVASVLEEQDLQRKRNYDRDVDPNAIAAVYNVHSQHCVDAARRMGQEDEKQAKLIYSQGFDAQIDRHSSQTSSSVSRKFISVKNKVDSPPRPPRRSTDQPSFTSKRSDAEIWNSIPNYYTLSEMSHWMSEPETMIHASLAVN